MDCTSRTEASPPSVRTAVASHSNRSRYLSIGQKISGTPKCQGSVPLQLPPNRDSEAGSLSRQTKHQERPRGLKLVCLVTLIATGYIHNRYARPGSTARMAVGCLLMH